MRRLLLFLAISSLIQTAEGQDPPRFRVEVDAVEVDVRVERWGHPVAGLSAANFQVRDSGVVQDVRLVTLRDLPLHFLLLLDTSGSVRGEKLEHLREAVGALISTAGAGDRVSVLTFSHDIRLIADASEPGAIDSRGIQGAAYGTTSVNDALFNALALRRRDSRRTVIVVFSDGEDTQSWLRADRVIEDAQRSDVVVYAVVPRPSWDAALAEISLRQRAWLRSEPRLFPQAMLALVTEDSGGELFYINSGSEVRGLFAAIVEDFRSRYLLTYSPEGVPFGGWHPVHVELKGAAGKVTARRGYLR